MTTATLDELRQAFSDLADGTLAEVEALQHEIVVLTAERDEARATVLRLLQAFSPAGKAQAPSETPERALEAPSLPTAPSTETAVCRCGSAFEKDVGSHQTICQPCRRLVSAENWTKSKDARDAARLEKRAALLGHRRMEMKA